MLLEFTGDQVVMVNKKPLLKNFRLNLAGNKQLRLKLDYLKPDGTDAPVDVVVYHYSGVELKGARLQITFTGEERLRTLDFKLALSYEFLKRKWKLSGNIGPNEVSEELGTFLELITVIPKYL